MNKLRNSYNLAVNQTRVGSLQDYYTKSLYYEGSKENIICSQNILSKK